MFSFPETIDHSVANELRDKGLAALQQNGEGLVDASTLKEFDSSVIAILMAWLRVAPQLRVQSAPVKLKTLTHVYGLQDLIRFQ